MPPIFMSYQPYKGIYSKDDSAFHFLSFMMLAILVLNISACKAIDQCPTYHNAGVQKDIMRMKDKSLHKHEHRFFKSRKRKVTVLRKKG